MSQTSSRDSAALIFGGVPRAHLMPPEVALRRHENARRRGLVALVLLVTAVVAAGIVMSYVLAAQSLQRLESARAETDALLAEQQQYSEVLGIQSRLDAISGQRTLLTSGEVEWLDVMAPYLAVFTEEEIVDSASAVSNRPFETPLILSGPLRSPRSATLTFSVLTASTPDPSRWITEWSRIATFADMSVNTIALDQESSYLSTVTINLNSEALSDRADSGEVQE